MTTKKILFLYAIIFTATIFLNENSTFAQAPQKMSFQAVIRNSSNGLVTDKSVGVRISILQGSPSGNLVYSETQNLRTNSNGLLTAEIGGAPGFASIDWANGPYYIKTETDPSGGTFYTITGTTQLMSVPYALHAITAESLTGGNQEVDPVFAASPAGGITAKNISDWSTVASSGIQFSISTPVSNQLLSFNPVSGKWENWTPNFLTNLNETDPVWTAVSGNYYTKSNFQTAGSSQVNWLNITDRPTTLSGYGITDAALLNHTHSLNDLANISTSNMANKNLLMWNGTTSKWANATLAEAGIQPAGNYLTSNQSITLTGDITGSGTTSIITSLADNGVAPGNYTSVNVNSKGLITSGNNPTTLSGYGITDALPLIGGTMVGKIVTAPSTTTAAGLNLPHGNSPTAPVNGDIWSTSSGVYARISGITVTLAGSTGIVPISLGGTGATTVAGVLANLGLSNVNNTSDMNKPVSLDQQTAINLKEDSSNKSTDGTLATNSDQLFPTEQAVKTYVNTQITNNATPDATTLSKGKIQLAGIRYLEESLQGRALWKR